MDRSNVIVFDLEADNLYLLSKKIWYIKFKTLDGSRELALKPFEQGKEYCRKAILDFLSQFDKPTIAGHNILGYDLWMLWKHLDLVPRIGKGGKDWIDNTEVGVVDTYALSSYLVPDSLSHSLEYLATGSESEKINFRQVLIDEGLLDPSAQKGSEFSFFSEHMVTYCDRASIVVFDKLWSKGREMYSDKVWPHKSFRQFQKDYWLYSAQAYSGVKFDKEKAVKLLEHIDEQMAAIKAEVDPVLPPRPLKTAEQAFYKIPSKPFKKNGELSETMLKWLAKHNARIEDGNILAYNLVVPLVANEILPVKLPMEIDDNNELKQYFLDSGWVPHEDFWNLKKDPITNKPVRDERGNVIKTTPKIQNAGQLCPNLLKLNGDIPAKVVKFLSYRNRRGVVQGWLDNWRIEWDGRISAEISGYTPTFRVKHKTVDFTSRL